MLQLSLLSFTTSLGMSFFLRYLSRWLVLLSFVVYQLLFSEFVTPFLAFSVYSVCAFVFFIDALVLLLYDKSPSQKNPETFLFFIDSLFLFALLSLIGAGGFYLFLWLAFFQVLSMSFRKEERLLPFVLWLSFLFSLGFLTKHEGFSFDQKQNMFIVFNLSLALSFFVGKAFITFLKGKGMDFQNISSLSLPLQGEESRSLAVALRLSQRFKPALRSLIRFLESSASQKESLSKQKEDLSYQIRQLSKLQELGEQLDQLSQKESFSFKRLNINEVVQGEMQKLLSHPERPSFLKQTLELHAEGWMFGSAPHLERMCKEILLNSFQSVRKQEAPEVQIRTYNSENKIVLEFTDNGLGAGSEDLSLLLEPLFTHKLGHPGLGFSFVSKIVQAHKGSIEVQNKKPRGFRVLIYFPSVPTKNSPENRLTA